MKQEIQSELTDEQKEVIDLMISSKDEKEWNANADTVKRKYGGSYPSFWYADIVLSGLMHMIASTWENRR